MTEPTNTVPNQLLRARIATLIACYSLLGYFLVASVLALGQITVTTPVIFLIQTLPLLILLPGLHKSRPRSFAWLSFVIMMYFIHGVVVAFDPVRRYMGLFEVSLCVVIFVAVIIFIRAHRTHYQQSI